MMTMMTFSMQTTLQKAKPLTNRPPGKTGDLPEPRVYPTTYCLRNRPCNTTAPD